MSVEEKRPRTKRLKKCYECLSQRHRQKSFTLGEVMTPVMQVSYPTIRIWDSKTRLLFSKATMKSHMIFENSHLESWIPMDCSCRRKLTLVHRPMHRPKLGHRPTRGA
ncbi:hypothetical protein RSOL_231590 [Rhizoctonia solani AG-3 Rhs1AP]|uniref:Uncharacterized protein n=2 Tax=Rhizoctonia solani AG-3 TaxID=1086053 RepID=A0A074RU72_9AGAM|nr:hypothetical protein RSOL_231590 [Rhizoctonia solani AG-3 Rhs1AP]KEP48188.1 hypothetical protein V565_131510 [Rhizoctonia solani 123E]